MQNIISKTVPVSLILVGLGLLFSSFLSLKIGVPQWLYLLLVFLVFNITVARLSGHWKNFITAWSVFKIYNIIYGFILGLLPVGSVLVLAHVYNEPVQFDLEGLTITTLLTTFATVCWEELWFRGIALEWGSVQYSKIGAAVVFGLLFVGLHFLNPQIDMLRHGVELFLAGYTLSIAYFLFGSIWAPVGMHYANNLMGLVLKENTLTSPIENHLMIYTLVLGVLAVTLTFQLTRKGPDFP